LPPWGVLPEELSFGDDGLFELVDQDPLVGRVDVAEHRPIDFWEARNRPRTNDYPFTLLELHLDQNDRGAGKMLAHTRIFIDPRTSNLVLENYRHLPVRLNRIRPR
jgi:hypothetical protein